MSYLNFYKLKELPFSNVPDLRYFYNCPHYTEPLNKIIDSIKNGKQLITVYGKCGLGKTVISRKILNSFEYLNEQYEVFLLVCIHSDIQAGWFLKKISLQLHAEPKDESKGSLFETVTKAFLEIGDEGKGIVILIDEANMIEKVEVYEEIRGLINFMADNQRKFSITLFGLPSLEERLANDEPLMHRVETRVDLKPLPSLEMTKGYIDHRLNIAGGQETIFDQSAYSLIHRSSGGNPRLINIICDNALIEGYLRKQKVISEEEINYVIVEMGYNTRLKSLFLDANS